MDGICGINTCLAWYRHRYTMYLVCVWHRIVGTLYPCSGIRIDTKIISTIGYMKNIEGKTKRFLTLILWTITIISCKKNEIPADDNPVLDVNGNFLNKNAYILDTTALKSFVNNGMTILKSAAKQNPKAGDVLISAPSTKAPYGFLVKIVKVTETSGEFNCTTEPAGLHEAFKQLIINHVYQDTFSSTETLSSGASLTLNFGQNALANNVRFAGSLNFNIPTMRLEYVKRENSVLPEKMLVLTELNTSGSLEVTNASNAPVNIGSERTLKQFRLPDVRIVVPIITPVGPFPIPMIFGQVLKINALPLNFSGVAKWTTIPNIKTIMGAKYEKGSWTNLCNYTIESSAPSLWQGNFSPDLNLTASLTLFKPIYELSPYRTEAFKAYFAVPNILDLTVQKQSPNYSLSYKLDVTGGADMKFWGPDKDMSITGNVISKTILEGNFDTLAYNLTNDGVKTWKTNPLGITKYCGNNIVNPPVAMDDTFIFNKNGTFTHRGGSITSDNNGCSDGGDYTTTWAFNSSKTAIIIGGGPLTIVTLSSNRLILNTSNGILDLIPL
jgi:hypothetical protein